MKTILCLAAAIFFAALGVVSLALIFGWFGVIQILNKAFPVLPIRWAYAITFELIAIFAIHALLLMPDRGAKKGNGRPILLVHGYLHHAKVWGLQKKWLEALGAGPIYTINLGPPFQSIRTYAEKVSQKAQAIAQETGRNDLILIGHSMGGLVSSWYAAKMAQANTPLQVITLGSPFHGTPVARIGLGANAREMEPDSPFLRELLSSIEENPRLRFYHIATETDFFVIPGASAMLEKNDHFLFRDIGHTCLLFSKEVASKIHQSIKS